MPSFKYKWSLCGRHEGLLSANLVSTQIKLLGSLRLEHEQGLHSGDWALSQCPPHAWLPDHPCENRRDMGCTSAHPLTMRKKIQHSEKRKIPMTTHLQAQASFRGTPRCEEAGGVERKRMKQLRGNKADLTDRLLQHAYPEKPQITISTLFPCQSSPVLLHTHRVPCQPVSGCATSHC